VLARLYAILDVGLCRRRGMDPLVVAAGWLDEGVRLIQLRAKELQAGEFLALATTLSTEARRAGATFLVNDRADVALLSRASGVHLGQDDLAPEDARRLLPPPAMIGVSTHTDEQVSAAVARKVDYLAIGPVFETHTKDRPDPVVGLEGVRRAAALAAGLPVVAIGGITLEQAQAVIGAGASSVAVISDLFAGGTRLRVREFLAALDPLSPPP
jgi:thiamine-phosphate pyrophosphorylase